MPTENPLPPQRGRGIPKYFYLNGDLHRKIRAVPSADRLEAWNERRSEACVYSLYDAKRRIGRAFTKQEVAKLLNRSITWVEHTIYNEEVENPQFIRSNKKGWDSSGVFRYMYSEEDIKALHDFLVERGGPGGPRKDGRRYTYTVPPWRLIKAWIHDEEVLYVMRNGKMVPTFLMED